VNTITVDESYRGVGLAKALYGIVLSIMKRPLIAGSSQTSGGRKIGSSFAMFRVEMKGYFAVREHDFVDETIDTIMGRLGGQYIGEDYRGYVFFAFDVRTEYNRQRT